MQTIFLLYALIPCLGFLATLCCHKTQERLISSIVLSTLGVHAVLVVVLTSMWGSQPAQSLHLSLIELYSHESFRFVLEFYFDQTSMVFAWVGCILMPLVMLFSRFYMHRDEGYQRYFCGMLLFYTGYSVAIVAGNFETLFIGWELVGFTSFILIAYFRDRYLPVKNAYKVLSLYRLGDVCLILGMWMAHHVFHTNITFAQLEQPAWVTAFHVDARPEGLFFITAMLFVASLIKSAQFPFSSWLPRAMEGPTTSSAIFYGALSAHLGLFLLLRTSALWGAVDGFATLLIWTGLATALAATLTTHVQSTIKTQIAYASITQMGIMLIEIGLGLETLALVHFAGHAFLRAYQLLVSPSTLGYRIHNQFFEYQAPPKAIPLSRWRATLYMIGIKEWYLDQLHHDLLWRPFKWLGLQMAWLQRRAIQFVLAGVLVLGILIEYAWLPVPAPILQHLAKLYALLSLLSLLSAFSWRGNPIFAWWSIVMSQFLIVLAIALNVPGTVNFVGLYLTTTVIAAVLGFICLHRTYLMDKEIHLDRFHGYVQERPEIAIVFLICCIGLIGFPFTPTFIAMDLMMTQIQAHEYGLVVLTALGFLFLELATIRIYLRVYLGQHKKHTHPIAYRSS